MMVVLRVWRQSQSQSQSRVGPKNMEYGFLLLLLFFHLFVPYSFVEPIDRRRFDKPKMGLWRLHRFYHTSLLKLSRNPNFVGINSIIPTGKPSGVCISQGGRFPPFKSEGNPPKKGPKDLTLCRIFRKKTCCDITHTHSALLSVRKLASTGEASQECLHLWELLECAICDPHVGAQPGPPLICASFCERIYEACSNAYFSMDVKTQILAPCGVNDFVCGRAAEWVSNGTDLCLAAGFRVKPSDTIHVASEETSCYGDIASLSSVADSWKASQFELTQKGDRLGMFDDFQQWVREMPFSERVSWAIGGMVLTAGLVFISKRKSHSQRQKLAAIKRTARKLEGRMVEQRPSSAQETRKRNSR